jgi:phenylacetate-coenzyme A ligase PaaK-like adenylate-forming protein
MLDRPAFELPRQEKEAQLLERLAELTAHHRAACPPYARMLDAFWPGSALPASLAEVPWLPVGVFKSHELRSVPRDQVVKTLTSSGTTGQSVSLISLDREASARQTRALADVMRAVLGERRRPMLIVDSKEALRDRGTFGARGAGILGMSTFGRDHCYALGADGGLRLDEVREWLSKYAGQSVFVFGFTFLVWQHLVRDLANGELDLPDAVLVHGGGWKALADQSIGRRELAAALRERCGVERVHDYYGMVEQIGSVFLECANGRLHAPNVADVIVRDPADWSPAPDGNTGVVQVLSALPESYPGHSILTEDLGTVLARDDCGCGWLGTAVELHGRVPRAELRGCSDTRVAA